MRVYGVCKGGGGVIVSLLARDKRTYHDSHNRDFYMRLVAISTYIVYRVKITLKTHTDYSKAVRGSGTTTINLYATPWQTP